MKILLYPDMADAETYVKKTRTCLASSLKSFEEVAIAGPWTLSYNLKTFLLRQENQILIFATDRGLELLVRAKADLSDGTFKTALQPFVQICFVFGAATE